ncbi:preprotein translocase subunit YajC [Yinghuangia seranimata]|uniref:preprotein translocase subunit YajC n=1 Tax=Yinghuangia seranimata TaxID=408067 RepID=UPI00248AEEC9|nr:preprotein translocase subunit YajC [Yinghuangia seranimata]MDI2132715.1 preprotein translocase subunit YajC [Yinghuangia seranimata]
MNILILLPLMLVLFYLLLIRPARKRQMEAMQTQKALGPGSEVRTVAGLFATVSEVEDDSVILEIAPGVHCRYLKSAIAAVLSTGDEDEEHDGDEHDGDHEHDEHGAHEDVPAKSADGDAVDLGKPGSAKADGDDGEHPRKDG